MKNRAIAIALLAICNTIHSQPIDFEDLSFTSGNFENGANLGGSVNIVNDPFGPSTGSTVTNTSSFTSGTTDQATFETNYTEGYTGPNGTGSFTFSSWTPWAYSRDTDTTTAGFVNQYSAIPGSGFDGSSNYGISFGAGASLTFDIAQDFAGRGLYATNTTYAYLSMLNGDAANPGGGPGKQFGGVTGNDPDEFVLTITGWIGGTSGTQTGSVDFHLADFSFSDNSQDYIVDDWTFVDLSTLGTVDTLSFDYTSTDTGSFGINTPTYFAVDNIGAVPEPSSISLVLLGLAYLFTRRNNK
ncbi:MAG: DUF4465 domain-containing protein [Verrucomicrobiota bacterium]